MNNEETPTTQSIINRVRAKINKPLLLIAACVVLFITIFYLQYRTQVDINTQKRNLQLTEQAIISTSTKQSQIHSAQVGTATPQAAMATAQAGTATPQAAVATAQAGTGTPQFDYNYGFWEECEISKQTWVSNFSDFAVIDANAPYVWPGSIIQGERLSKGELSGIPLKRQIAIISINDLPNVRIQAMEVENPSYSSVTTAIQNLLPDESTIPQAEIEYYIQEYKSVDQAILGLGGSLGFLPVKIKPGIEKASSTEKTYMVLAFKQNYFTVSFDDPLSPTDVFKDINFNEASKFMGENNPPAYVKSVTYGRMLLLVGSSTTTSAAFRKAIEFNIIGDQIDLGIYAKQDLEKIVSESEFQVIAYGGSADTAIDFITGRDINKYLNEGVSISSASFGKPISYRVNYLINNQPTTVSYATSFEALSNCTSAEISPANFKVTLDKIKIHSIGDITPFTPSVRISLDFSVNTPYGVEAIHKIDDMTINNGQIYPINQSSKRFELKSRNDTCFKIDGIITRRQLFHLPQTEAFEDRICFHDGKWEVDSRTKSKMIYAKDLNLEIFYSIDY